MRRRHTIAGLALLVSACATSPDVSAKIDAAIVGLSTAESLALIYTRLPRCVVPKGVMLCSDPATVQKIKDLDMTAYNAVKAAEKNGALVSAALDAVQAFQTAIPKITSTN